jgi:hypothetical protein
MLALKAQSLWGEANYFKAGQKGPRGKAHKSPRAEATLQYVDAKRAERNGAYDLFNDLLRMEALT